MTRSIVRLADKLGRRLVVCEDFGYGEECRLLGGELSLVVVFMNNSSGCVVRFMYNDEFGEVEYDDVGFLNVEDYVRRVLCGEIERCI